MYAWKREIKVGRKQEGSGHAMPVGGGERNVLSGCREEESPRGRLWVRTRESRGGLSEGGKGGLLHSQLVELGQLLKG